VSRPLERLQADALDLPANERARLAQFLIASLDEDPLDDPAEVEKAWEAEIYRRLEALRSGRGKLVSADDALEELRRRHA